MSEKVSTGRHESLSVDEHITLQAVTEEEAERLFSITDESRKYLAEYLPWVNSTKSPVDSLDFIKTVQSERANGSQFGFGIYFDGQLAGHISLMHVTDDQPPEIGYWIAKQFSGKGITTKAAEVVTKFGFETLGVREIIIKARVDNAPSNGIPSKLDYELLTVEHKENESVNVWRKVNE